MASRKIMLVTSVFVLLLLAVFGLRISSTHQVDRVFGLDTTNLQNAWLDKNFVYFYSGSFFGRYNLSDNTVEQLSDYLLIDSGITSPSWRTNAVVFQTNPQGSTKDDITTAAASLGVSNKVNHWWKYNFSEKQYYLLDLPEMDSCTVLTQLSDNLVACAKPESLGSDATTLSVYNLQDKTEKKLLNSDDPISKINGNASVVYFTSENLGGGESLHHVNIQDSKDSVVYKSEGVITLDTYNDGSALADIQPALDKSNTPESAHGDTSTSTKSTHSVVLIKGSSIESKKKVSATSVYLYSDTNGAPSFSTPDGTIYTFKDFKFTKTGDPSTQPLKSTDQIFSNSGRYFALESDGNLVSSPQFSPVSGYRRPADFNLFKDNAQSGDSWIDEDQGGVRKAYIYRSDAPASVQQQAVGDNLSARGFRPHEFNLSWVTEGPDYSAPISPKVSIIR